MIITTNIAKGVKKKMEHKEEPKRDNSTLDQANDYLQIFSFAFINI